MAIPGAAGPGAPFPQWTVNTSGYIVAKVSNATEKALAITATYPDKLIFFTSQNAANTYAVSQGHTPITTPAAKLGGQKALDVGSQAAQDVLGGFNITTWFIRIGEILLGIVLIGVGVARITGAQNAISNFAKTKMPIPI